MPAEVVVVGLEALIRRGVVKSTDKHIVLPNYVQAQETPQSDKARQQKSRELARDLANAEEAGVHVANRDEPSQNVTGRHGLSRDEAPGHAGSQDVTPYRTVPYRTVPSVPNRSVPSYVDDDVANEAANDGQPTKRPFVPAVPERPQTEPETWGWDEFRDWFQFKRHELGYAPEDRLNDRKGAAWFSAARMSGFSCRDLREGVYTFAEDAFWVEKRLTLMGFVSQWTRYVQKGEQHAAG
jgi:hypothetical protein